MRAGWWWIDRWRKSTAYTDMTLAEQGAYRNLLDELWLRDGVLPDDERILAKICGDALSWPQVREAVMARFEKTERGYVNTTHDEVSAGTLKIIENQREKGRKRAENAERNSYGRFQPLQPHDQPPDQPDASRDSSRTTSHQTSLPSPSPSPSPLPEPSPEKRKRIPRSPAAPGAWSHEACDDFKAQLGGTAPGGEIGRHLKPLVAEHGWDAVRPGWRAYLKATEPEFVSAKRFANTFGKWKAYGAPQPPPRELPWVRAEREAREAGVAQQQYQPGDFLKIVKRGN